MTAGEEAEMNSRKCAGVGLPALLVSLVMAAVAWTAMPGRAELSFAGFSGTAAGGASVDLNLPVGNRLYAPGLVRGSGTSATSFSSTLEIVNRGSSTASVI